MKLATVPFLAVLIHASGGAQAAQSPAGEDAADCAALWQGVALEAADNPSIEDTSESASLIARQFSVTATAAGLTGQPLRAAILDALPGYRLLYRGVIAGDQQSREVFDSHAAACAGLLGEG